MQLTISIVTFAATDPRLHGSPSELFLVLFVLLIWLLIIVHFLQVVSRLTLLDFYAKVNLAPTLFDQYTATEALLQQMPHSNDAKYDSRHQSNSSIAPPLCL